jgi:hypothetical protein
MAVSPVVAVVIMVSSTLSGITPPLRQTGKVRFLIGGLRVLWFEWFAQGQRHAGFPPSGGQSLNVMTFNDDPPSEPSPGPRKFRPRRPSSDN